MKSVLLSSSYSKAEPRCNGDKTVLDRANRLGSASKDDEITAVNACNDAELHSLEVPVLLKSVSAPVLPSFRPHERKSPKPSGCSLITATELSCMIDTLDRDELLILDVRPFSDYSRSCLKNSIHVCLPSTLLRRKSFNFKKLIDNLAPEERIIVKEKKLKNKNLRIIIYDGIANQQNSSVSLACGGIAKKIIDSDSEGLQFESVSILSCGFGNFERLYSEHVFSQEDSMMSRDDTSTMDLEVQIPGDMTRETIQELMPPQQVSLDSPVSSSSPISALSKFKLPSLDNSSPHFFKIAQNEQLMNIESYLSAVNIKEENEQSSMQSFQFPQTKDEKRSLSRDKLRFQMRYAELEDYCDANRIDDVIPLWFQRLMKRSKIEFISQFQKLDFLERKRLNKGINKHKASQSATFCPRNGSSQRSVPYRSYSQPDCIPPAHRGLKHFYSLDSDEEDDLVTISSGVELGIKNRYKDIFPYEHTRVVLKKYSVSSLPPCSEIKVQEFNEAWTTYINANYLDIPMCPTIRELGMNTPGRVRYIATQAPLASTVHDFFTCILNNRVPLVVTLTDEFENGMEKCHPYWKEGQYDDISVRVVEDDSDSTTTRNGKVVKIYLRRLQLRYDRDKTFELLQIQIRDWPDLGTLLDPTQIIQAINLKNFVVKKLFEKNVYSENSVPTILVHCSAGCGRTGTWCTVDSIISNLDTYNVLQEELADNKSISDSTNFFDPIVWTVNTFRKQRISIVQNVNQFLFIYECLFCFFTLKINNTPHIKDQGYSMNNLLQQIKELKILQNIIDIKTHEQLPTFT
ncbi:hypothetical protein HG536_0C05130 [Torulaspora globosa]|uniref:protein-tyrosine-phosphatase n=1 Tax=Torulaspora globosa TaxID=48254 RepID=A0A7G3ZFQ8_9SACH|nr:uncharacterized protein HG536_0C05130 [Torulaspora globosa]QLL32344.1 hypothetical protein HG536_0C05130 [Torulaspora globosa]